MIIPKREFIKSSLLNYSYFFLNSNLKANDCKKH